MRRRSAQVVAWGLVTATFVLWGLTAVLWRLIDSARVATPGRDSVELLIVIGVAVLIFGTTGGLVAAKRPENPIGWIFASTAAIVALKSATGVYADLGRFVHGGDLPMLSWVAWLSNWVWVLAIGPFATFVFLLYPTGRPPSRRWNKVAWLAAFAIGGSAVSTALTPGPLDQFPTIVTPVAAPGWAEPVVAVLGLCFPLLVVAVACSVASLVVRARRGDAIVREQVKWIAYAGAFLVIGFGYAVLGGKFTLFPAIGVFGPIAAIAIAAAIAIQRYRLFDIDRLISRTISYGLATSVLVGAFAAIVVIPTAAIGSGKETPDYVIAIATLLAAVLFRPLHNRTQRLVDRRFNRSRYDAQHTLDEWTSRVREQTDLETLEHELVGVVRRTMQPQHAFIWIASGRR